MNLNEKALVRLMRTGYKGGGVKLFRDRDNETLFLSGGFWAVGLPWACVPGPVLGVVAEWLHRLPVAYEGYHFLNGAEGAFTICTQVDCGWDALSHPVSHLGDCKIPDVRIGPCRAAQLAGGAVYWLPEDGLTLLDGNMGGHSELITIQGDSSAVDEVWGRFVPDDLNAVIWLKTRGTVSGDLTRKLSEFDFWGGDTHGENA